MKKNLIILYLILFIFLLAVPLWAKAPEGVSAMGGMLRFSFEEVTLPQDEKMGLLGGTFLFEANEWLSAGFASYGALTGERGGFITLGLASELRFKLHSRLNLSGGFFVGAGGGRGGFTLQGGGLMLRPHLGLDLVDKKWGDLGLGLSLVSFPNGNIDSVQPYFAYSYPFETFIAGSWLTRDPAILKTEKEPNTAERAFAAVYRTYRVPDGVRTDGGSPQHPTVNLVGVEWIQEFDDRYFLKIESEGALGGRSNGYMQILLGGGLSFGLSRSTLVRITAQAGVAGGGAVDTGGGLLLDLSFGLDQRLSDAISVGVAAGLVDAPDGDFKARSLSLQLRYHYGVPAKQEGFISFKQLARFDFQHLRLRTTHQTYFEARSSWRNHHPGENVDLLGMQGDYFVSDTVFFTGQGLGAYAGNAGGYMTGLWGMGLHLPLFETPTFVELEGLLGAAGGGGLDVAGGFVWQGNLALGYELSKKISLLGSWGYMSAPNGNFRATVLGISVATRFTIFTK